MLTGTWVLQRSCVGGSGGACDGRAWLQYPPRRLRRMLRDACARDERLYVPYTHFTGGFTGKSIHFCDKLNQRTFCITAVSLRYRLTENKRVNKAPRKLTTRRYQFNEPRHASCRLSWLQHQIDNQIDRQTDTQTNVSHLL